MSRNSRDLWNCPSHFEQPRNPFVQKIMKMKIVDAEQMAGSCETGADRVGAE
jgi:hypothetical protein